MKRRLMWLQNDLKELRRKRHDFSEEYEKGMCKLWMQRKKAVDEVQKSMQEIIDDISKIIMVFRSGGPNLNQVSRSRKNKAKFGLRQSGKKRNNRRN